MPFYPEDRIALFIDGANLYSSARNLGFDIDFKKLRALFGAKGRLVRRFYYTALMDDRDDSPLPPPVGPPRPRSGANEQRRRRAIASEQHRERRPPRGGADDDGAIEADARRVGANHPSPSGGF